MAQLRVFPNLKYISHLYQALWSSGWQSWFLSGRSKI